MFRSVKNMAALCIVVALSWVGMLVVVVLLVMGVAHVVQLSSRVDIRAEIEKDIEAKMRAACIGWFTSRHKDDDAILCRKPNFMKETQ
jgi:hypothetical protein